MRTPAKYAPGWGFSSSGTIPNVKRVKWLAGRFEQIVHHISPVGDIPSIHQVFKAELLIVCVYMLRNRTHVPLINDADAKRWFLSICYGKAYTAIIAFCLALVIVSSLPQLDFQRCDITRKTCVTSDFAHKN